MAKLDADLRSMLTEKRIRNENIITALTADAPEGRHKPSDLQELTVGRLGVGGVPGPATVPAEGALGEAVRLSGPRWGASEGGLDGLGWVRDLITMTERAMASPSPSSADTASEDSR